ncbi:MAG: IS66 family transposase, partial [Oligoflexus sp.]
MTLKGQDLDGLKTRIKKSNLAGSDVEALLALVQLVTTLRSLVEKRRVSLLLWLRRIFGLKTEKSLTDYKQSKGESSDGHVKKGRMGRHDYPGAERTEVCHPHLKAGDTCPICQTGKLREVEPGVDYDWQGNSPIHLHIYLLQRFICHKCKEFFTAPSPIKETAKAVDDSEDEIKVTKRNRNAFANAVVACLRFMFGIPFYRLAKIQDRMGIGLPEGNQYAMVAQVYDAALPVYGELVYQSAQGSLILADDTAIKILDWLRGKGPPTKTTGKPGKKAQTTAIVSKSAEGHTIVLYLTDEKSAGRHVENLLEFRQSDSGVPIYMCDGLSANLLNDSYRVIQVHCLDHARRMFYEIQNSFPSECKYVLEKLKLVYKADKETK